MFDIKLQLSPNIIWVGLIVVGVIVTTITKIMTRNHISRNNVFKYFETKERSNERYNVLGEKIDDLKGHISERFDDIKCIIEKGRG